MNFDEYQKLTKTTAKYEEECRKQGIPPIIYTILGLAGEAGEISDKYKKIIRDDHGKISIEKENLLIKELGDVMWYISEIATQLNVKLCS